VQRLTIQDVEAQTGIPRRTIYYYIKEGLIPPPVGTRRSAMYTSEHVLRLWLVQALKEKTHLRLEGIREILDGLNIEEARETLVGIRSGELDPLDLVAHVRPSDESDDLPGPLKTLEERVPEFDNVRIGAMPQKAHLARGIGGSIERLREFALRKRGPAGEGEEWRRFQVGDGVEIHYRETDDDERDERIRELISFAERILGQKNRK